MDITNDQYKPKPTNPFHQDIQQFVPKPLPPKTKKKIVNLGERKAIDEYVKSEWKGTTVKAEAIRRVRSIQFCDIKVLHHFPYYAIFCDGKV